MPESHSRQNIAQSMMGIRRRLAAATLAALAFTLAIIAFLSPLGLIAVLLDGTLALFLMTAATGFGFACSAIARWKFDTRRWRLFVAATIGLGITSLLMLGLGAAGMMNRAAWIGIESIGCVLAIWLGRSLFKHGDVAPEDPSEQRALLVKVTAVLSLLAPFAAFACLSATMPPGMLWPAEGGGYDALEYHLGAPRDFIDAGRIDYLPHNIYSNFPFNVEMLYLLIMILRNDMPAAALSCQMVHCLLGMLFVFGCWVVARDFGRSAGAAAAVLAGTTPFLVYLSGLAYVEHGLLVFSIAALGAAIRASRDDTRAASDSSIIAGLCAGLACGCKYTGILSTAVPLFVSFVVLRWISRDGTASFSAASRPAVRSAPSPALFVVGLIAAFSPWLIKNVALVGNPIFPLGYGVFGANDGVWTDELAQQWERGHQPPPEERTPVRRAARFLERVPASRYFGPVIAMGAAGVTALLFLRRSKQTGLTVQEPRRRPLRTAAMAHCGSMLLIGATAWCALTHLVDRFAIVLIAPCTLFAALAWADVRSRMGKTGAMLGTIAAVSIFAWNFQSVIALFTTGRADGRGTPINYLAADLFGRAGLFTEVDSPVAPSHLKRVNRELRDGHRVLVVADARRFWYERGVSYCVVFNRNEFAESAEKMSPIELISWLRARGFEYVYVDWGEMKRLRSTYGFWPSIDLALFDRLVSAGLKPIEGFSTEAGAAPYGSLFQVPRRSPQDAETPDANYNGLLNPLIR